MDVRLKKATPDAEVGNGLTTREMKFSEFCSLPTDEQGKVVMEYSAIRDSLEINRGVEESFLKIYDHPKIDSVCCGGYGIDGGWPVLQIDLFRSPEKLSIPKTFMGFKTIKRYRVELAPSKRCVKSFTRRTTKTDEQDGDDQSPTRHEVDS